MNQKTAGKDFGVGRLVTRFSPHGALWWRLTHSAGALQTLADSIDALSRYHLKHARNTTRLISEQQATNYFMTVSGYFKKI